jgi:hypothetical protein
LQNRDTEPHLLIRAQRKILNLPYISSLISLLNWGMAAITMSIHSFLISDQATLATARAFLRQRSALSGSIAKVVSDVNRQLTGDVKETGRFMTLFYRANASASTKQLLGLIIEALDRFQEQHHRSDDITPVIVKMIERLTA